MASTVTNPLQGREARSADVFSAHYADLTEMQASQLIVQQQRVYSNLFVQRAKVHEPMLAAARHGDFETVKQLLDDDDISNETAAADDDEHVEARSIDCRDRYGRTPLMLATIHERRKTVRLLLLRGAEVDLEDADGFTALLYAAAYGFADIFKILLEYGANIHHKNKANNNSLSLATMYNRVFIIPFCAEAKMDLTQAADKVVALADPSAREVLLQEIERQQRKLEEQRLEREKVERQAMFHYRQGRAREEEGDCYTASLYYAVAERILPETPELQAATMSASKLSGSRFMGFVTNLDAEHGAERRCVINITNNQLEIRSYTFKGRLQLRNQIDGVGADDNERKVEYARFFPYHLVRLDLKPLQRSANDPANATLPAGVFVKAPNYAHALTLTIAPTSKKSDASSADAKSAEPSETPRSLRTEPTVVRLMLPDRLWALSSAINQQTLLSKLQKLINLAKTREAERVQRQKIAESGDPDGLLLKHRRKGSRPKSKKNLGRVEFEPYQIPGHNQ